MHCAVPCQSTVPSFRFQGPCASFTACASHVRLRRNSWCPRAQFAAATPSLESPVQASPAHEREPRIYQDATAILGNTPMVRLVIVWMYMCRGSLCIVYAYHIWQSQSGIILTWSSIRLPRSACKRRLYLVSLRSCASWST